VGEAIARSGAVLVCGGLGGVMEYACMGAREAGGVTIGILPGAERLDGNKYLTYSIPAGIGEARNSIVVRSSDAIIAIGGEYGTLSEIAFALKFKKPVIGLNTWIMKNSLDAPDPIVRADNPEKAVKLALAAIFSL